MFASRKTVARVPRAAARPSARLGTDPALSRSLRPASASPAAVSCPRKRLGCAAAPRLRLPEREPPETWRAQPGAGAALVSGLNACRGVSVLTDRATHCGRQSPPSGIRSARRAGSVPCVRSGEGHLPGPCRPPGRRRARFPCGAGAGLLALPRQPSRSAGDGAISSGSRLRRAARHRSPRPPCGRSRLTRASRALSRPALWGR